MKKHAYTIGIKIITLSLALTTMLAACSKSQTSENDAAPAAGNSSAETSASGNSVENTMADEKGIGFPLDETITLVVPGKSGGGSDLAIRYYSEALNRIYGLRTTVINYDSNTIGHQTVAAAKPDGTTLTVATAALNIQYITGNAEVNPLKDFTLIACLQSNGFSALAVPADAPYDDFAGFVDYAKEHPGELNAGMPAAGNNTILFGKLTKATGIKLNSVEAASESDRLANLAGGFIDIGVVGVGNGLEYEKAGKLKIIGTVSGDGITIAEYPEELPDNFKTLQEQGFADCYHTVMHYLLGPAGMDETMVIQMNGAMKAIVEDETVQAGIAGIGNIPGWHDLEESAVIRQEEYDTTVEVAKDLGLYVQE